MIVGDANLSDMATYLKMGSTAIVLSMIEAGFLRRSHLVARPDPVAEMHAVSHDTSLRHQIALADGRRLTRPRAPVGVPVGGARLLRAAVAAELDEQTRDVLDHWERVLTGLETDPDSLADEIDWIAKKSLMEGFMRRDGLAWDSPRLQLIDLQYADIRPDRGLAARLEQRGRLRRMFDDEQVARAVDRAARRHPGLLPRRVHAPVPAVRGGRVVGLRGLRRARQ